MRLFASFLGIASLLAVVFAPAASAQSSAAAAWQVSTMSSGIQVAFFEAPGPMRRMAMACQAGAPMLTLVISLRSAQLRANLELTGTVGGRPVTVPMVLSPRTGAWWTILRERAALDLLAGGSSTVSLTMGGARLGTIPLSGSSNAIRTALASCYVSPTRLAKAPPAAVGGVKLVAGHYVSSASGAMKCSDVQWDIGYYSMGDAENYWEYIQDSTIFDRKEYPKRRITSATSFVDGATKFDLCPENALDPDARRWPDSQRKPVNGLPIKPGLYRTFAEGKLIPRGNRCGIAAEYLLFEPTRVAFVAEEYILDRNGYPTTKFERARKVLSLGRRLHQIGARVYVDTYDQYGDTELALSGPWLIEASDKFTISMGECDEIQFRPVDPRSVPAALMPRF